MVDIARKASKLAPPRKAARPDPAPQRDVASMVESIVGCKWSLLVLDQVRRGVNRPGAMTRAVRGLSTKVLNQRLVKMQRFGILQRTAYPEVPPRVEYRLTDFGRRFLSILDRIEEVQRSADTAPR